MASNRKSTRQRLVQAALQLFSTQGVTATTTRQVADLAGVNEVTLFRHFGSKHGLLLAVIEEAEVLSQLEAQFGQAGLYPQSAEIALTDFAEGYLETLAQIPEFIRSVVGEAGQFSDENRQAIGRGLAQTHRFTVQYLNRALADIKTELPIDRLASLLTVLLLGYTVIEFTSEFHHLWPSREAFIDDLVRWTLPPEDKAEADADIAVDLKNALLDQALENGRLQQEEETFQASLGTVMANGASARISDLPAPVVRSVLQAARKSSLQDYALVYVLFGSGLTPAEAVQLQRSQSIYDNQQHILQVGLRQVPLNQWIMGHRYGSFTNNPLTKWFKSRKDTTPAAFVDEASQPITEEHLRQRWQAITANVTVAAGTPPQIEQARHTWCVEMLLRGMDETGLSILTGLTADQIQPYVRRAQERAALEQAIRLDRQPGD